MGMVTVEEEESVAAFKDFVVDSQDTAPPTPSQTPSVKETPPIPKAAAPLPPTPTAAAPLPSTPIVAPPAATSPIESNEQTTTGSSNTLSFVWGEGVKVKSP